MSNGNWWRFLVKRTSQIKPECNTAVRKQKFKNALERRDEQRSQADPIFRPELYTLVCVSITTDLRQHHSLGFFSYRKKRNGVYCTSYRRFKIRAQESCSPRVHAPPTLKYPWWQPQVKDVGRHSAKPPHCVASVTDKLHVAPTWSSGNKQRNKAKSSNKSVEKRETRQHTLML